MPEILKSSNPFNVDYPAGKFFVGRENQLRQLDELLKSLSEGVPSNLYVVGKGGEGKTSYLDKIVEESQQKGMLAFRCTLDIGKSAETHIDTIISKLLQELEVSTHQEGFEKDWQSGKSSTYRTPRLNEVRSEDLANDFRRIYSVLVADKKACVICIDEGQRIHPLALSALKNSLQSVRLGYMIVLSLLNDKNDVENEKAGRDMLNDLAIRSGDPGASRFFQNVAPLGLFDTQAEAEECIAKRLENNIIKFAEPAISLIAKILGRHPRKMVIFAHAVYELAKSSSQREVGVEEVRKAFLIENRQLIREVEEFRENLSGLAIIILRELSKFDFGITSMDFTKKMNPNLEKEVLVGFSTSIQAELDRLCKTKFCRKLDGGIYHVPEPEFVYALKLTLGEI